MGNTYTNPQIIMLYKHNSWQCSLKTLGSGPNMLQLVTFPNMFLSEELDNLVSYCERMKNEYWPDWNERILNSETYTDDNGRP
jgi:hypothetical protein